MHVDDTRADAFRFQQLRCLQGFLNHEPAGDDRDIASILKRDALSNLEGIAVYRIRHDIEVAAARSQVARSLLLEDRLRGEPGLIAVARHDDRHARDRPHQTDVLDRLVRRAVFADRKTRVAPDNLHVQTRVADVIADLIVDTAGRKDREGMDQRGRSACCEARCHIDHVRFRDAHIVEPLRILLGEILGHRAGLQVRVKNIDILIPAELGKGFSICDSC